MGKDLSTSQPNLHYKAGGTSVELTPHEGVIGIDTTKLSGKAGSALLSALQKQLQPIGRGIALVSREKLSNDLARKLEGLDAVVPVFESDGATLVALPEVRVEGPTGAKVGTSIARARRWLKGRSKRVKVVTDEPERLVVQVSSGRGEDAVALADEIAEKVSRVTATPRFIRLTRHPGHAALHR